MVYVLLVGVTLISRVRRDSVNVGRIYELGNGSRDVLRFPELMNIMKNELRFFGLLFLNCAAASILGCLIAMRYGGG